MKGLRRPSENEVTKKRENNKQKNNKTNRNNFLGEDSAKAEKVIPASGLIRPRPNHFFLKKNFYASTSTLLALHPMENGGGKPCVCVTPLKLIKNRGGPLVESHPRRDVHTPATRNRGDISGPALGRAPTKGGWLCTLTPVCRRLFAKKGNSA